MAAWRDRRAEIQRDAEVRRAYLGGMMDIDRNFEEGIHALVRGFAGPSA